MLHISTYSPHDQKLLLSDSGTFLAVGSEWKRSPAENRDVSQQEVPEGHLA